MSTRNHLTRSCLILIFLLLLIGCGPYLADRGNNYYIENRVVNENDFVKINVTRKYHWMNNPFKGKIYLADENIEDDPKSIITVPLLTADTDNIGGTAYTVRFAFGKARSPLAYPLDIVPDPLIQLPDIIPGSAIEHKKHKEIIDMMGGLNDKVISYKDWFLFMGGNEPGNKPLYVNDEGSEKSETKNWFLFMSGNEPIYVNDEGGGKYELIRKIKTKDDKEFTCIYRIKTKYKYVWFKKLTVIGEIGINQTLTWYKKPGKSRIVVIAPAMQDVGFYIATPIDYRPGTYDYKLHSNYKLGVTGTKLH